MTHDYVFNHVYLPVCARFIRKCFDKRGINLKGNIDQRHQREHESKHEPTAYENTLSSAFVLLEITCNSNQQYIYISETNLSVNQYACVRVRVCVKG